MSEVSMVRRRRRRRVASPVLPDPARAAPLDDDDLLLEILLRLPPQPSSLLRASVVCKRWRRLVSDPGFLRRFRAHHRKAPLLGFFSYDRYAGYCFTPTLDRPPPPPDRIPAGRFSPPPRSLAFVDCRHGLALFLNKNRLEAVVWNPISGHQRRVAVPPEFDHGEGVVIYAAVLCAAGDDDHGHGHVHGDCDLSSFVLDYDYYYSEIIRTEENTLGLIFLTKELRMQLWERKVNSDDVGRWVLQKTIELVNHLSPRRRINDIWTLIQGYNEDHNVLFLRTYVSLFMIQLDSMQFKSFGANLVVDNFPYTSFYSSDWATGGRDDGPGMSSST
ncbi:unnamed protein product [Alopecurus aequalis]